MKKMKRILLLVLVLVMSVAATSTVFARGFGGGRMMHEQNNRQIVRQMGEGRMIHMQNNRQIVCQIGEDGICLAYEEGICPVWGHVPGQGRNNDRGFRGCRRLQ